MQIHRSQITDVNLGNFFFRMQPLLLFVADEFRWRSSEKHGKCEDDRKQSERFLA